MTKEQTSPRRTRLLIALCMAALGTACGADDPDGAAAMGTGGTAGDPTNDVDGSFGGGAAGAGGAGVDGGASEGLGGQGGSSLPEGPAFDAGPDGLVNNPIDELFADPARSPWDFLGASAQDGQAYVDAAEACFSEPGACDSQACGAFAACCPASGSCCEPLLASPIPESLDFRACAGDSVTECFAEAGFSANSFGEDGPILSGQGLVPNGSASAEGGVLVGELVDLASLRVQLDVQLRAPVDCNGTCLESAGVGFSRLTDDGELDGVAVGLLLSGSREVVQLLLAGQVADSFPAAEATTGWRMTFAPRGEVEVRRDGVLLGRYPFDSESLRQARLTLFGRNLSAPERSAAIESIDSVTERCDNPRGWTERAPLEVTVQGEPAPTFRFGVEPSISDDPERPGAAFALDAEIFIGETVSDGRIDLPSFAPALRATEAFEAGGVGDPELLTVEGTPFVYYTAWNANGAGSIAAATLSADEAQKELTPMLVPEGDVVSYDAPTAAVRDGLVILVVRATLRSGASELRAFYSADPQTGWARIVDSSLEALTRVESPTEEIGSPSLVRHNSAYQLYYARRQGTRWSVEIAASDELLFWRPLGEALGGSGEGFDSQGARGLDARSVFGRIEAVYSGQDGVSFQLGFAARPAPSGTASTVF